MKSDKEFWARRGNPKIIKTELLDSLFLFILLFVVVGFPVNDQLIHYFHVNTRLVNQISYPNIRNDSSINAGMSSGCLLVTS